MTNAAIQFFPDPESVPSMPEFQATLDAVLSATYGLPKHFVMTSTVGSGSQLTETRFLEPR